MKIEGKRTLITGGSSGIGLAVAKALAKRGARVLISGRRAKGLADALIEMQVDGVEALSVMADVSTDEGRQKTIRAAESNLGGLDILINNAGGVRAGRLERTSEADIRAMIEVDLVAPILLSRMALPYLRLSGDAMIVNVTSNAALLGMPFYTTYAGAKAGLARFGEALRRELFGEGIHVLTVYPAATETPMMATSQAGSELGFTREPASDVAEAVAAAIETDALNVFRGGEGRLAMIVMNRENPARLDLRFSEMKSALEVAVEGHSAL
jgi:uncharacterized oxidoreductase